MAKQSKVKVAPPTPQPVVEKIDKHKAATMFLVFGVIVALIIMAALMIKVHQLDTAHSSELAAQKTGMAALEQKYTDQQMKIDAIAQAAGDLFQKQGYAIAAVAYRTQQIQNATGLGDQFGPMFPAFENQTAEPTTN